MGPIVSPETSVRDYHYTLRKIAEKSSSQCRPPLEPPNLRFVWYVRRFTRGSSGRGVRQNLAHIELPLQQFPDHYPFTTLEDQTYNQSK